MGMIFLPEKRIEEVEAKLARQAEKTLDLAKQLDELAKVVRLLAEQVRYNRELAMSRSKK